MVKKQIDGIKYVERKEGDFQIIYPNGKSEILNNQEGLKRYKVAYATNYADKVADKVLKELGLTSENAHLFDESKVLKYKGETQRYRYATGQVITNPFDIYRVFLEKELRQEGIDLSFLVATTKKYHVALGGNAGAIAHSYAYRFWHEAWQPISMTKEELAIYLKKHKNIKVFETVRYDYREVTGEVLLNAKYGKTSRHMGIGSQASEHIDTIELKRDKKGNLLLAKFTEIYD
jgi:hypothetical protein